MDPGCETATASTELYDPARRRFVRGPRLSRPRVGHAAILLRDGSVLVLGGWSGGVPTATAERLVGGRFVAAGPMLSPRGGFTATRLRDGRVLVVGGTSGSETLASAELYDPATGRFAATGSLARSRNAHTATLLRDGRVLVVGRLGRCRRPPDGRGLRPGVRPFLGGGHAALAPAQARGRRPPRRSRARRRRLGRARLPGPLPHDRALEPGHRPLHLRHRRSASPGSSFPTPSSPFRPARSSSPAAASPSSACVREAASRGWVRSAGRSCSRPRPRCRAGSVLVAGGYDDSITPTAGAWLYRSG